MDRNQRIALIGSFSPYTRNFLLGLNTSLESEEFRILRDGGNPKKYDEAISRLDTRRCQLFQGLRHHPSYNPVQVTNDLVTAEVRLSDEASEVIDRLLATEILKSLPDIGIEEALRRFYLCLTDSTIDSTVRGSAINQISLKGNQAVITKLQRAKEFFEINPDADPDSATLLYFLDEAIKKLKQG